MNWPKFDALQVFPGIVIHKPLQTEEGFPHCANFNLFLKEDSMKKIMVLLACCLFPGFVLAELPLGAPPPAVVLSGEDGGLVKEGAPWESKTLAGKVSLIFYVDPDERDLNNKASEALEGEEALEDYREAGKFASYAIINMAATWLPNAVLTGMIEDSQEEFPNTTYVFDMNEVLHKKWDIATDSNNIIVTNMQGDVVFSKDGQLSDSDIQAMIQAIHEGVK